MARHDGHGRRPSESAFGCLGFEAMLYALSEEMVVRNRVAPGSLIKTN